MVFGAHNVNSIENGIFETQASHVFVNPDWSPESEDFDADIAILITEQKVKFSRFIKPICIQSSTSLADATGFTAGWGKNEYGKRGSEPTEVIMPIIENGYQCLVQNPTLSRYSSLRTFCAGTRNGTGPCTGDSGGGLYVYNEYRRRFYLQGIVSAGLIDFKTNTCDLNNYVLYTNMNDFHDWLQNPC